MNEAIKIEVCTAAKKLILFLPHAIQRMSQVDRMIDRTEVVNVVMNGEVIENYPHDPRGHSCLMLSFGAEKRPIHVVCAPRKDYLAIITAYIPNKDDWSADFKQRL